MNRLKNQRFLVNQSKKIAVIFSDLLRKELTKQQLSDVIRLNKIETDDSICHSHDFTDANILMQRAFFEINRIQFNSLNEAHICMWADSWLIAKENNFQI